MKIKAEFNNSAFVAILQQKEQDSMYKVNYELSEILYKEEKYAKALKKLLPIVDESYVSLDLKIKMNLLIGQIYRRAGKYEKSLESLSKSLKLNKTKKKLDNEVFDEYLLAENYLQISSVYKKINRKDSSNHYLKKILSIKSFNNDILNLKAKAYLSLGNTLAVEGELDEAEKNILKSIDISENVKNEFDLVFGYMNLANIYVERKKYNKGKDLYDKALAYLKRDKSLKAMKRKEMLLDNIAWALYNLKDYTAYEYVTESYAIRDSLKEEVLTKQVAQIQAENDVEKVQQAEQDKREKLERKTWVVGIVGVVVSLLLLFLANLYKLRQRNLSLKLSQNELRQQRKLERLKSQTQVKILNATIDGKETERKQIAEILHDNVSALLSSAHLHLQASQKQFEGAVPLELQKTQQIIVEASQKIRDLSHNLISSVLLKFGLEYAIKDLAKKFSNSSIKINTAIHNVDRYSEQCEIKIFNIIQELVNNILKHSNAENAYIIMEEEDSKLNIIVKDDGKGFENKLDNEKGIGLNHIKARIKMMKGHFLIETALGEGTKVMMNIPVIKKREMVIA